AALGPRSTRVVHPAALRDARGRRRRLLRLATVPRIGAAAEADLVEAEPLVVRRGDRPAARADRPPVAALQRRSERLLVGLALLVQHPLVDVAGHVVHA